MRSQRRMEARLQVLPAAEVERVSEYAAWELAENREIEQKCEKTSRTERLVQHQNDPDEQDHRNRRRMECCATISQTVTSTIGKRG